MKWVQASEKLPPVKVDVVIKEYSGTVDIGWYSDVDGRIHTESDLGPLSINQVEWLDETESPSLSSEEEAIGWEQVFENAQSMHLQEFINYYKNKSK